MILITGATGHFGTATIKALLDKGISASNIAGLIRDESKAKELKKLGIKLKIGDYDDYNSLISAFENIEKLVLVSGDNLEKREKQHKNVVDAAAEAGVQFVVYTSFERKNETNSSPIAMVAKAHLATEEFLKNSGMDYTIMRNSLYADFIPMFVGENVLETGIYLPAEEGKTSFALREEMAEAAAVIVSGNGHSGKEYAIGNVENYSFAQISDMLSDIAGKKITYTSPSPEEYKETLSNAGVPEEQLQGAVAFAIAIREGEFYTEKSDLEMLLGRKPTPLKQVLQSIYKK